MKRVILLLQVLGFCIVLTSCDEILSFFDDSGNTTNESSDIRIKKVDYYNNDTIHLTGRADYMYDDYNKIMMILYSADMFDNDSLVEHGQSFFNYDGNTITEIDSSGGNEDARTYYTMNEDKLMKSEEKYKDQSGNLMTESIIEYAYDGNLLKKETHTDNNDNKLSVTGNRTYDYENNMMTRLQYFTDWNADTTDSFVVVNEQVMYNSNGKLDSIHYNYKMADGSFQTTGREFFTYKNDLLTERRYMYFNNTNLVWLDSYTYHYRYNDKGQLSEEVRTFSTGGATKTMYEWEMEKGNLGTFWGIQYYRYIGIQIVK